MIEDEPLISLAEAAKCFPRHRGRHPHIQTLYRWTRHGRKGVRLESVWAGHLCTSREAIRRFMAAVDRVGREQDAPPPPRRRRDTARQLDRLGI